ncbi:hypothetical protein NL676_001900 [Syzygium grande]|nr:hypothetical protein NL676_001900 [Syzygium grande]
MNNLRAATKLRLTMWPLPSMTCYLLRNLPRHVELHLVTINELFINGDNPSVLEGLSLQISRFNGASRLGGLETALQPS